MVKTAMGTVSDIDEALGRLASASATVEGGWVPESWSRTDDSGTQELRMNRENVHFREVGVFSQFGVESHRGVRLETVIDLPANLYGIELSEDALELTINSIRPIDIAVDGESVFRDALPVVASGPALITLIDKIQPGRPSALALDVLPTPVPLGGEWGRTGLTVQFTTPGLRDKWRTLDLAHARLYLAREFADTPEEIEDVARAARSIPPALEKLAPAELDAVLRDCGGFAWLDGKLAEYRVHCVGHSHIDLAWLWTYDDTREVIFRDMESVIGLFEDYPEFRFTHSQARTYAEVESSRPALFRQVRELIAQGRLEPATLQWVEADANIPSGESQARQLIEGVTYSRSQLQFSPKVLLAPDTFGHAGNMPQLAVQAGAEVYYHHRANPGFAEGEGYWQAYWWVGDDGTRLLSVSTPVYLGPVTASRLAVDLVTLGKRNGVTDVCYFYGVGDHGGGPTRADLDTIRHLDAAEGFPRVVCATVSDYAAALLATDPDLPTFTGESERVFEGCYTTHADSKRLNRESENALIAAETLASISGTDASATFAALWRATMHHQFHDILGGSAVAAAFDDQDADASEVLAVTAEIESEALRRLHTGIPRGRLVVTNTLGHRRRELVVVAPEVRGSATGVVDAGGGPVATQVTAAGELVFFATLEPFGVQQFGFVQGATGNHPSALVCERVRFDGSEAIEIETPFYEVEILARAGSVVSVVDRRTGAQLVGRGARSPETTRQLRPELGWGVIVKTHELPHPMTSWVEDYLDIEQSLLSGAVTRIVETGPVRTIVEAVHAHAGFDARVRFALYATEPHVDVDVEVDWREAGGPDVGVPGLAVSFGTRERASDLWAETPFAAVRREPDGYRAPMLRWADLGSEAGGLAVANDAKHGVDALGPRMRIPLVRSAYEPDPRSDADRVDRSRFRLLPHRGSWRDAGVVEMAASLNNPPSVAMSRGDAGACGHHEVPVLTAPTSIIISSVGRREDRLVLRCYESVGRAGETVLCGLAPGSGVTEQTIVGSDPRAHVADGDGSLSLSFGAFEVKTLLVTPPTGSAHQIEVNSL